MNLLDLPPEILLYIARDVKDPLDLLDLRLTHPSLNYLLLPRFSRTFPRSAYMRKSPSTNREQFVSSNTILFFAAQHNYQRLLAKVLHRDGWHSGDILTQAGLRQACVHAARNGNIQVMKRLLRRVAGTYSEGVYQSLMVDCLDVALSEDRFDVSVALVQQGLCASWENEELQTAFSMVMEAHRLDVLDYIIGLIDSEGGGDLLPENSREEIDCGMNVYMEFREDGRAREWCQRIIETHIRRWGPDHIADGYIREEDVAVIGMIEKRNCGPECDVWFSDSWGKRTVRLDKEEMMYELVKLRRGDYEVSRLRLMEEQLQQNKTMDTAE